MINLGNSPYAQINSTYTDAAGQPAASAFIYGGDLIDSSYSHGVDLAQSDIIAIISDQGEQFPVAARSKRYLCHSRFSRHSLKRN